MPIKIKMIDITIINSSSVNPARLRRTAFVFSKLMFMLPHHSEYGRPSVPVSCELEYTSKTFFPHQLCESGSSETQRNAQSFCFVIGSTGISLMNRTFLSCTFTPLTSVSKLGG